MEAVRPLMKTLLTQMAKAFPGQNLKPRHDILYASASLS
jgi:hypothetical protein